MASNAAKVRLRSAHQYRHVDLIDYTRTGTFRKDATEMVPDEVATILADTGLFDVTHSDGTTVSASVVSS